MAAVLSACGGVPDRVAEHRWQTSRYDFPGGRWEYVPAERIFGTPESMRTEFVLALRDRASFELPDDLRRRFRTHGIEAPGELRLFVVRGCSFGSSPTFAVVRRAPDGARLHVHQATVEPELLLPSANADVRSNPVIVALEAPPEEVIATADRGGDRVFRGWQNMRWLP